MSMLTSTNEQSSFDPFSYRFSCFITFIITSKHNPTVDAMNMRIALTILFCFLSDNAIII